MIQRTPLSSTNVRSMTRLAQFAVYQPRDWQFAGGIRMIFQESIARVDRRSFARVRSRRDRRPIPNPAAAHRDSQARRDKRHDAYVLRFRPTDPAPRARFAAKIRAARRRRTWSGHRPIQTQFGAVAVVRSPDGPMPLEGEQPEHSTRPDDAGWTWRLRLRRHFYGEWDLRIAHRRRATEVSRTIATQAPRHVPSSFSRIEPSK